MKKLTLFVLITAVVLLSSIITFLFLESRNIILVKSIPMDVKVIDRPNFAGINVDPDGFHFGKIGPGGISERELMIKNVSQDVFVFITKKGEIAGWVSNPNFFRVKKGEEKDITFTIVVPMNSSVGLHTGEAVVVLRRI